LLAHLHVQASAAATQIRGKRSCQAEAPDRATLELLAWLQTNAAAADIVCYGLGRPTYGWLTGRRLAFLPVDESAMPLPEFLTKFRVRYLVLDRASFARRPYVAKHFSSADEGIGEPLASFYEQFPNLRLAFRGRSADPFVCFEVTGTAR